MRLRPLLFVPYLMLPMDVQAETGWPICEAALYAGRSQLIEPAKIDRFLLARWRKGGNSELTRRIQSLLNDVQDGWLIGRTFTGEKELAELAAFSEGYLDWRGMGDPYNRNRIIGLLASALGFFTIYQLQNPDTPTGHKFIAYLTALAIAGISIYWGHEAKTTVYGFDGGTGEPAEDISELLKPGESAERETLPPFVLGHPEDVLYVQQGLGDRSVHLVLGRGYQGEPVAILLFRAPPPPEEGRNDEEPDDWHTGYPH